MSRAIRQRRRSWATRLAVPAVATLALAGCAGGGTPESESKSEEGPDTIFRTGLVGDQPDGGDPVDGGRLSVSAASWVRSLDPVETIASGLSGGTELAAIYDVLVRYDPETAEYEPQLAKSLTPNEDSTTWTLTLRDGVEFSDGTPLDADAVVASITRYLKGGGDASALWQSQVKQMTATDERTVEFRMARPWPEFEYMLASGPGMIVAPTADQGGEFTPIGAGPFTLVHQKPSEELLLAANEDYWGGEPHLDELRFASLQTGQGTFDLLETGGADVAVFREPNVVKDAVEAGYPGAMTVLSMGFGLVPNTREGSATADVRVRRAISMALDPEVVYERTYDGVGLPGTEMFADVSRWHTDTAGPQTDLDAARALVKEAKADGFDGTVGYLGIQQVSTNTGVAIEAMLGNIGIEVEPNYVSGIPEMVETVFVQRDFDLAGWSFGTPDAAVFPELYESFHSESTANAGGYANPEMDALIAELGTAEGDEEQRKVLSKIQEEWNATVPALALGAQPEHVAWQEDVHGIVQHVDSTALFGEAWVEQ